MATLQVVEIFDSLQGEGSWAGYPMTFVRLAGCNAGELGLDCRAWCDTPQSWAGSAGAEMEVAEVLDRVSLPRLCLTGGEPLLQLDSVMQLAAGAHQRGLLVHLETNGTVGPPTRVAEAGGVTAGGGGRVFDWVVVSPKPPDYFIARGWRGLVDELKLVVDGSLDSAIAEKLAAEHPESVMSIQPLAGAPESLKQAVDLVMRHSRWRLSLQIHKLLGLR